MIRAIVFDCFGVLTIDAQQYYRDHLSAEQSREFHELSQMRDHGFLERDEYFTEVSRLTNEPVEQVRAHFLQDFHANDELIAFIRAELRPHYKIGMLSNIGRGWINSFFSETLRTELFDTIVLSGEEGITKPNPLIYERTADRLGVAPDECVMIDDIERNCTGAREAGMQAVLYRTISQLKQNLAEGITSL